MVKSAVSNVYWTTPMVKSAVSNVYWTTPMVKLAVSNVYSLMVIHNKHELP